MRYAQSPVLASEPFGPLNGIHALGFLAALIEAARFVERSLRRGQVLGSRPTGTFRLLSCRGPAPDLALHVLGRSGASLCRLPHGSGRRMLLTGAALLRRCAAAPGGFVHVAVGGCCGRPDSAAADDAAVLGSAAPMAAVGGC
jgi:hypothetical protein